MAHITEHIASIPLFEGLPRAQHDALASVVIPRTFDKGRIIFAEGDDGTGFYVVIEGRVKVYKLSPEGKEQTLHIVEPGEPFGEVAVFAGRTFPAFAEASSTTRVLFVPRDAFVGLLKEDPSLALNMMAMLSGRLRKFTRLVEDLSLKEVPARLAAYFLHLSDSAHGTDTISLDLAKGELASLLGTIPETLSRILTRMAAGKLIETEGGCIRILDRAGLEEIARSEKKLA